MSNLCEIVVKGHLDTDWSGWFEGLAIRHNDNGETMLSGQVRDQAALYGLIAKVRDIGLCLILVKCMAGKSAEVVGNEISGAANDS